MKSQKLQIKKLFVNVGDKEVLHGVDLVINKGEIHVIMGPNGSGKSTLANALMGHPKYKIIGGTILLDGKDITDVFTTEKAKAGLFLSMQHSPEIHGVTINNFLRTATEALSGQKHNPVKFYGELGEKLAKLNIDKNFIKRYLNVGFSGGEKKQMEIIQLLTLNPKYAILDEIDSGLDVDALKMVAKGINKYHTDQNALLLITHYNRILKYVKPDFVHIMKDGKIVQTGDKTLAKKIEKQGYK